MWALNLLTQHAYIFESKVRACTKTHPSRNKIQFAQQCLTKSTEPFNRFPIRPKWSVPLPHAPRGTLRGASSVCSCVCLISKPCVKWRGKSLLLCPPPAPNLSAPRWLYSRELVRANSDCNSGGKRDGEVRKRRRERKWSTEQISKCAERLNGLGDKVRDLRTWGGVKRHQNVRRS